MKYYVIEVECGPIYYIRENDELTVYGKIVQ